MAGVVEARPGRRLAAYRRWLANEYHGEMGYMARPDRVSRREDLEMILPGVRSLVCVALDYSTAGPPKDILEAPSRGRISNYAWGVDYHDVMTPRLMELAAWLQHEAGSEVAQKVYVDTGAILERDHAETAGLRIYGQEHHDDWTAARLLVLPGRAVDDGRPCARSANLSAAGLWYLPPLPGRLPDRRLSRALCPRCSPLYFLPYY